MQKKNATSHLSQSAKESVDTEPEDGQAIQREEAGGRPNSYAEGKGLTWAGGDSELTSEEAKQFVDQRLKGVKKAATLIANSVVLKLNTNTKADELRDNARKAAEQDKLKERNADTAANAVQQALDMEKKSPNL